MAEDHKYKQKLTELRKRIRDVEEENNTLNIKLFKARKSVRHLKLERTFLLDRMEKSTHLPPDYNSDNSEVDSEIYPHEELDSIQGNNKHDRSEKLIANKPQRKKKDPNAPKGPGNVFFLFCRLERDKIKDECPAENPSEVTRLLGQKWKSLTKEEKKKYYDLYKHELEEYEEAMKSYNTSTNTSDINDISVVSSPAQSIDFTNDHTQHHDSLLDDDIVIQSDSYHNTPEPSA
ncbi:high mobility group box domain-containing protein [Cokeromyces recurvatus]|uniref:high mobility group box domain-containing protein n=1 Tax=Cokeromyces recurvatus TaxID=90255 RepID=UPI0022211E10|nr:high mobility group box domain-containing protein [Cokeromyces recurvatus]KAI7908347.1 high mobility group box domain-containing protein [Cokeromyces recurvatus]